MIREEILLEHPSTQYQHKFPVHHNKTQLYRIIIFIIIAVFFAINCFIQQEKMLMNSLKFLTFWGFYIVFIYFGYMVIKKKYEYQTSNLDTEFFHIVLMMETLIGIVFWTVIFPKKVANQSIVLVINSLFMHFVTQVFVWIEFFINKRIYQFSKRSFIIYILFNLIYMINNFILGYYYDIHPYPIILWKTKKDFILAFALLMISIASYFLIFPLQKLKFKKVKIEEETFI